FALMVVLAAICGVAGTWQLERFHQKHEANQKLRLDDGDRPADIATVLGAATAQVSDGRAQKFRHVTATGTYLSAGETLLRDQTVNGDVGYVVLTPLRTSAGVLIIARGFLAQTGAATTSPPVPASPAGTVTVTARLQPADSKPDRFGRLPGRQVETVNVAEQAGRLHAPVWNGYAELLAGQPGAAGLTALPNPDLSNPAGGADEPQHAAYVVQWYLFGVLALCAPFVMAAAERRRDQAEAAGAAEQDGAPPATSATSMPAKSKKASLDDRLAGRA
ncbi:SURF1 family protein, partial [Jatrophihabitans sp.]|uniref:SURF1 family protein n=1 Tax=Jatrophihabitans sp. TaxID=1932789 RepID=UPI002CF33382|nr:SURF1 family protein [Jatrophihabitans sp.]